ncbi:MAG: OmpA family protein [Bacteroidaceae bacterium]|nr:OmpA family protein [Bacteroidaceae bacterium]
MLKKFFFSCVALLTVSTAAMAQEKQEFRPHWFAGLQGGVQNTFNKEFNNWKTFTPTATLSLGYRFSPVVGARVGVNGIWNKSGVAFCNNQEDEHYRYNYITPSADVLVNLCTLFGKKDTYPVNLIFVGGLGANYAFEGSYRAEEKGFMDYANFVNCENDRRWAFNGRLGLMLDVPICKAVNFNVEADLNNIYTGNEVAFNRDHLQLTAQAGLAFKFGYQKPKRVKEVVAEPEPVWQTRIDTVWYDDVKYVECTRDRDIKKEIFFGIRESKVASTQDQIKEVAEFLKGVRDGEVTITGYADKGTGTPRVNMKYSKQRAEQTKQALLDCGVEADKIKNVEWKGDTVQPYAENDKNRVSIITGHGVYTDKDKVVEKKFRTKEVRYRVQ